MICRAHLSVIAQGKLIGLQSNYTQKDLQGRQLINCESVTFGLGVHVVLKSMWRGINEAPRGSWLLSASLDPAGEEIDARYWGRDDC